MLINAYYRNDFSYSVEFGGITNRDAVMVSMKVDTGSPYTIISLETRYPGLSDEKVKEFRDAFQKRHNDNVLDISILEEAEQNRNEG